MHLPVIERGHDEVEHTMEWRRGEGRDHSGMNWPDTGSDRQYINMYGSNDQHGTTQHRGGHAQAYASTSSHVEHSREVESRAEWTPKNGRIKAGAVFCPSGEQSPHQNNHATTPNESLRKINEKQQKHSNCITDVIERCDIGTYYDNKANCNEEQIKKKTVKEGGYSHLRQNDTTRRNSNQNNIAKGYIITKNTPKDVPSRQTEKENFTSKTRTMQKVSNEMQPMSNERNYMQASTWRELVSERRNSSEKKDKGKRKKDDKHVLGGELTTVLTKVSCRKNLDSYQNCDSKKKVYADNIKSSSSSGTNASPRTKRNAKVVTSDVVSEKLDAYERTMMELSMVGDGRLDDIDTTVFGHRPPNESNYARSKYGEITDYGDIEDLVDIDVDTNYNESYQDIQPSNARSDPSPHQISKQDYNDNNYSPSLGKESELSPRQVCI